MPQRQGAEGHGGCGEQFGEREVRGPRILAAESGSLHEGMRPRVAPWDRETTAGGGGGGMEPRLRVAFQLMRPLALADPSLPFTLPRGHTGSHRSPRPLLTLTHAPTPTPASQGEGNRQVGRAAPATR